MLKKKMNSIKDIYKLFFTILVALAAFNTVHGQQQQELCPGDTAIFRLQGYKAGDISWQKSPGQAQWHDINDVEDTTCKIVVQESMYYRAKVLQGTCDPFYSEVYEINALPLPIPAIAGTDITDACVPVQLNANTPSNGSGQWSIITGSGGSFVDEANATTNFSGNPGETYSLQWAISTPCDTSRDTVNVSFMEAPSTADAGTDTTDACVPVQLNANAPSNGSGQWSIITGSGGNFDDEANPTTNFSGNPGKTYTLQWAISTACDTARDTVNVSFMEAPTTADAGTDITDACVPVQLNANTPSNGSGQWNIITGSGGNFDDEVNPTTNFSGNPGETYTLQWAISTACDTARDTVNVSFLEAPTPADAGTDTTDACVPVQLNANTPSNGSGQWNIITGSGGSFDDEANPTTNFSGNPGETYTLQWAISTACDTARDTVNVSFLEAPTTADAGTDTTDACVPVQLNANKPSNGSGRWSILSGEGGSFSDSSHSQTQFHGIPDSTYTLEWSISTQCDTSRDQVVVNFAPEINANFSANNFVVVKGDTIKFMDQSTGNPVSWNWELDNDSVITKQNFSYVYDSIGIHKVKLIVSNNCGIDSITKYITVIEKAKGWTHENFDI